MSKADKALQDILKVGGWLNVAFDELAGVPRWKGFVHDGGKSDHQVWRHGDDRKITLPATATLSNPFTGKQTARQRLEEE